MSNAPLQLVLRQLRKLVGGAATEETGDGVLLERFAEARDVDQASNAFEELLARHGAMVYSVCRRILENEHDAADAYQATFLVLARKARSIRKRDAVGSWLYGVAYRVARKARSRAHLVRTSDQPVNPMCEVDPSAAVVQADLRRVLDEELNAMPRKYRDPLVLCYFEGKTHEQAAKSLGWPTGTMSRRVGRGLEWLRNRMQSRGVTVPSAVLGAVLVESTAQASVPVGLSAATARAAALFAAGIGNAAAPPVLALADGVLHAFEAARFRIVMGMVVVLGLLGATAGVIYQTQARIASTHATEKEIDLAASLDDLQPTPAERRIDAIGWARDIPQALELARTHNRPVFLFTHGGNIATGRCGGSAFNLRAGSLADDRVITLVNRSFVPVFSNIDNPDGERTRLYHAAFAVKLAPSDECIYLLTPDGVPVEIIRVKDAKVADTLVARLEAAVAQLKPASGDPVVAPHPLSVAPSAPAGGLVLHLVSRADRRHPWGEFPAENWIVLPRERSERLIKPGVAGPGDSWLIDPELTADLLTYFYPQTENNDITSNRLDRAWLRATVVSVDGDRAVARIEGELRMKHRFYPNRPDESFVVATLIGSVEFEPASRRIRSLRLITTSASYGENTFQAGLRSEP
jgi:RNA polymerase sigma factor (sigma-70 family)